MILTSFVVSGCLLLYKNKIRIINVRPYTELSYSNTSFQIQR